MRYAIGLTVVLWLGISGMVSAQGGFPVIGKVVDAESQKPLAGVNLVVSGSTIGTASSADGMFRVVLSDAGAYLISARFVGYETLTQRIQVPVAQSDTVYFRLKRTIIGFDDVIVTSSPTGSGVRYQADRSFSGDELNRRRDVSIAQMLDGEPGVAMRSFGPAPARPVIRGLDGERILVLENGERMGDISQSAADHAVALDPQAMDRLEIIRGPASLLYGNSALGGVVNMITSDIPVDGTPGFSGNAAITGASVNNFGSLYTRLGYGGEHHAVTGRLSVRSAGDLKTPAGRMSGSSLDGIDGSLGYGFGYGNTIGGFSVTAMESTYGIPGDPAAGETVEIQFTRYAAQGQVDFRSARFFDRYQFRFHMSQFQQKEVVTDLTNPQGIDQFIALQFDQQALSATLNMQHRPIGVVDRGAVGINLNGRVFDVGGEDAFAPGDQYINFAAYTFQEMPLSAQTRMQAGLRADYRNIQTRENTPNPGLRESRRDLNLAGSIGMNFRPQAQTEIGISLARAHRYPTVEELYANGVHLGAGAFEIGNDALGTEVAFGSDAFLRWRGVRAEVEVTAFMNYIQNFIVFQPAGVDDPTSGLPVFRYESDDVRLIGGELSVAFRMNDNVIAQLGVDYVNGTRLNDTSDPLPFIPPLRFRFGLDFNAGRYWSGITLRHVFDQNRVAQDEDPTDGYTLLALQGGYSLDKAGLHRFVIRVENVMNTTYRDHLSRVEDRQYPMPARNVSATYSWNF